MQVVCPGVSSVPECFRGLRSPAASLADTAPRPLWGPREWPGLAVPGAPDLCPWASQGFSPGLIPPGRQLSANIRPQNMVSSEAHGKDSMNLADPGLLCGTHSPAQLPTCEPAAGCDPGGICERPTMPLILGSQGRHVSALACPPGGPGEEGAAGLRVLLG